MTSLTEQASRHDAVIMSLHDAIEVVRKTFPDAGLYEVRLEFRSGERASPAEYWNDTSWSIQVGNDKAYGDSLDEAISKLRANLDWKAQVPEIAKEIANILRGVSDKDWAREDVMREAQRILELERRSGREG